MADAAEQRVIRHAWTYGHFKNPGYPECHVIKEEDLSKLTLVHPLVVKAMRSVQASDANLEVLARMHHGRALNVGPAGVPDGEVGPATMALVELPRCQVPDFATEDDEFGLAGSGGWSDCDPQQGHEHEVVIKFDDRNAPTKWKGYMDQVKANAVTISRDMGLAPRYIDHDSSEDYQSSVIFKFISGGVIGYYYLPQGSGCRRINQGALDTSYQPDVVQASLLWIHEGLGHGVGLPHTNGGIMNPSLLRVPMTWRNDPSERRMKSLYGGVPIGPVDPPDPPTDPDEETELFSYKAKRAGEVIRLVSGESNGGWEG